MGERNRLSRDGYLYEIDAGLWKMFSENFITNVKFFL